MGNIGSVNFRVSIERDDVFVNIANFVDELLNIGVPTDELRVRALRRLINELIRLAKNAKFAMKMKTTQKDLEDFKLKLYVIKNRFYPKTFEKIVDQSVGVVSFKIKPEIFDYVLEEVSKIKSEINVPLNKNHLI